MNWLLFLFPLLLVFLNAHSLRADNKNYLIACSIYDENFKPVKTLPGERCVFLEDGSYISIRSDLLTIAKYSPYGELLWTRRHEYTHHQATLAADKKRLLILSSEAVDESVCLARHVVLLILDVQSGKIIARKSLRDFKREIFKATGVTLIKYGPGDRDTLIQHTNCHGAFFNGFNEIPKNLMETQLPAFRAGNYMLTNYDSHFVFIIDRDLKKIVWSEELLTGDSSPFHNAHVIEDGKILYYVGEYMPPGQVKQFAVLNYDPLSKTNQLIFPHTLRLQTEEKKTGLTHSLRAGNVQKISQGYLIGHNDALLGGQVIFSNPQGNIIKQLSNPTTNPENQLPSVLQDCLEADLSSFLKNNKM